MFERNQSNCQWYKVGSSRQSLKHPRKLTTKPIKKYINVTVYISFDIITAASLFFFFLGITKYSTYFYAE